MSLVKKLFTRTNYHINLTTEEEILFKKAVDILELVNKTTSEFESMNDFSGGDIHIGCAESYGISILSRVAINLKKIYPNIRFHLYSGNFQTVTEKLDRSLLDFAVVVQDKNTSTYNSLNLPHKDTWGIIMRKDSPLSEKKKLISKI